MDKPGLRFRSKQDAKLASGEAKLVQTQDSLMSDMEQILDNEVEGGLNTQKQSTVDQPVNSETLNIKQLSMFDSRKLNSLENRSILQADSKRRRTGLTSKQSGKSQRKSPLSLRQIINRLEKQ